MPELLLELLSEEIPARMQARAAEDLKRLVCDGLDEMRLGNYSSEARSFVTPRRQALVINDLPERQMAGVEVRKGPRTDAPEQAIKGFKGNLPKDAKIKVRETTKGTFHFASIPKSVQSTPEVLPMIVEAALAALSWPKSMRWGQNEDALLSEDGSYLLLEGGGKLLLESPRWVRPLRTMLCIFDGTIVPVGFASVEASNTTVGHRFMAPEPFAVESFDDYAAKLKKAKVILDPAERRTAIETGARKLAKKEGLELKVDPGLLDEVTGLVEWPVVLMGSIDKAFMELPPEVLSTVMRHHQKYLALLDKKGDLAPKFIVVSNTETSDKGKAIVAGNELVLSARLADAKFFWDQDRMTRLEDCLPQLEKVIFHAKLGTVAEKVERLQRLAHDIALFIPGADKHLAERAALLCKADLVTDMVVEFTDLQGVMGNYYALAQGEKAEVARAISDHYSPAGPNDSCPTEPLSIAVALADKIDSLVCFFGIDEKPTGSKDPFALRRAALGVIRLVLENNLKIPLHAAFGDAVEGYGNHPGAPLWGKDFRNSDEVANDLLAFFADRLKAHLRGKDIPHDHIDAVFALGGEDDLVRMLARVDALGAFLKTADGENLLTAYKRAANIVSIEEKNDGKRYNGEVNENLLELKEEKSLHKELKSTAPKIAQALKDENFHAAMGLLAGLRKPVDDFFDHVTVNCEDGKLRQNRLRILSEISSALDDVADFSCIEGGER